MNELLLRSLQRLAYFYEQMGESDVFWNEFHLMLFRLSKSSGISDDYTTADWANMIQGIVSNLSEGYTHPSGQTKDIGIDDLWADEDGTLHA